ncbi:MAG TPA: hypothetical protein PLZ15_08670 [Melioribacteraceae bacterium]|nr:hypothetical protein [Melioribacteraceae bacterium]
MLMKNPDISKNHSILVDLIAPCGMNCRLCWGFIREENNCPGCLRKELNGTKKSEYRSTCVIKNCPHLKRSGSLYCSERCGKFPCRRLKQLDKRYMTKYGISMIENLTIINEKGIRYFIRNEKLKWACKECGGLICVHKPACIWCGNSRNLPGKAG